jgi:hypothetical protein
MLAEEGCHVSDQPKKSKNKYAVGTTADPIINVLKHMYDRATDEAVPTDFLTLLEKLDSATPDGPAKESKTNSDIGNKVRNGDPS